MQALNLTQELIQFIFGILIGYAVCNYLYGDTGTYPTFIPTIPMIGMSNGHQHIGSVRIHHWMWGVAGLAISLILDAYVMTGACFALMFNGLSYEDCFDFES